MKLKTRWKYLDAGVYENENGTRCCSGLVRLPEQHYAISAGASWENRLRLERLVALQGGNRKRGLMLWAEELEVTE